MVRFLRAVSLCVLALCFALPSIAQGPVLSSGVYYLEGDSATLTDNGNGTYALKIEGVSGRLALIVASQPAQLLREPLEAFVVYWGLSGTNTAATLSSDAYEVTMRLEMPLYDAANRSLSFTARDVVVLDVEGKETSISAPIEFPSVIVPTASEFMVALANVGAQTRAGQACGDYYAELAEAIANGTVTEELKALLRECQAEPPEAQ